MFAWTGGPDDNRATNLGALPSVLEGGAFDFVFFVCPVSVKTIQSAPRPFNPHFRPFTAKHLAKPYFHAILPRVCQAPSSPIRLPSSASSPWTAAAPTLSGLSTVNLLCAAPHVHNSLPTPALNPLSATLMGSPRMCCKQKTYSKAKPFRCNTYTKHGGWGANA